MTHTDISARFCRDLMGGLADDGVEIVFISPGSRNTPLTLAAVAEPRLRDINIRDERSAGFMALGFAKATGRPAAVICTSGSAATHYFPAIVEADQSSSPLIVLTADRPRRLRGTSAPQTMNQVDLYGSHVKTFIDIATEGDTRTDGFDVAHELVRSAMSSPAGPVHANAPLDEPLVPHELPAAAEPEQHAEAAETPGASAVPHPELRGNVLIVAGGRQPETFAGEIQRFAAALGAPVLADPQCNAHGANVLANADLLCAAHDSQGEPIALSALRPDIVLRLGPLPTSKPLWTWLATSGAEQILVDRTRLSDPLGTASINVDADPLDFLASLGDDVQPSGTHLERWLQLDRAAGDAAAAAIAALPFPSEAAAVRAVTENIPAGSILYVASSRPIRDVDAFGVRRPEVRVIANRGVNGIDGTISSAIGSALSGTPTCLLIGDIAALHDATAFAEAAALGVPLRIVVVNNDGGGIFSFLPQARSSDISEATFERHWGTPHGLSLAAIAHAMGMAARSTEDMEDLLASLAKPISDPELIEIHTPRDRVVDDHEAVRRAVAAALGGSDDVEQRP